MIFLVIPRRNDEDPGVGWSRRIKSRSSYPPTSPLRMILSNIAVRSSILLPMTFHHKYVDAETDCYTLHMELECNELRAEYDFSQLKGAVKGRYAERFREGTNLVLLAPDVTKAFPTDEAVNEAYRLLMQIALRQRA